MLDVIGDAAAEADEAVRRDGHQQDDVVLIQDSNQKRLKNKEKGFFSIGTFKKSVFFRTWFLQIVIPKAQQCQKVDGAAKATRTRPVQSPLAPKHISR